MLKTSYILFVGSLAIGLGLAAYFSGPQDNPRYIGAAACSACHVSRASGAIQVAWNRGPHSRAFDVLKSDRSRRAIDAAGGLDYCLSCHSTISHAPVGADQERMQTEGVGCERCHGPGSEYSQSVVMRQPGAMDSLGGTSGSLRECTSCHLVTGESTGPVCPVDSSRIDPVEAWARIGHRHDSTHVSFPVWDMEFGDNAGVSPSEDTTTSEQRP